MENITQPSNYTISGTFDIACSFKPDGDAPESMRKHVTLRFHMKHTPLIDVITASLSPKRIIYQNGTARKNYDDIENRSIVDLDFTSPTQRVKSRDETIRESQLLFMRAGVDATSALELATKAYDNPELVS